MTTRTNTLCILCGKTEVDGNLQVVCNPCLVPPYPKITEESLRRDYLIKGLSLRNLTHKYGYSCYNYLIRFNIPIRSYSERFSTDGYRLNASEAQLRRFDNPKERDKISVGNSSKVRSVETRRKQSELRIKYLEDHPEAKKKLIEDLVRRNQDPEVRKRVGKLTSERNKRLLSNPAYKGWLMGKLIKAQHRKPSNPELTMMGIIKDYNLPFSYNGNYGGELANGKCPDFISTNGIKMVILIDGNYWHDNPFREIDIDKSYRDRGHYPYHISEDELYHTEDYMIAAMVSLKIKEVKNAQSILPSK